MFDSLDDQIKKDLDTQTSSKQRMLLWLAVAVASLVVFGGLYFAAQQAL
jgi:hypothetical protein